MTQVIVFPRGQLCDEDKARMQEAGFVAVEADDPSKVVMLFPSSALINADDLLMSALAGIEVGDSWKVQARMVAELHKRLKAREQAQKEIAG